MSVLASACIVGCGPRDHVLLGAGLPNTDAGGADGGGGAENAAGAVAVIGEPRVIDFVLVDANTGLDLRMLNAGDTIDVTSAPVTVRAVVAPLPASIVFKVDTKPFHTENGPPWAINGEDPTTRKLVPWAPRAGKIRIDAEPFSQSNGNGTQAHELDQNFVIE